MAGFLRFVGLLNAAVWFGAAIFFTAAVAPAVFSTDMRALLGDKNYPYYSGAIAQLVISHYFQLQLVCAVIAICHMAGERLYFGRGAHRVWVGILSGLVAATVFGAFWLQPRMKRLHATKYDTKSTPAQIEAASSSFRAWHGASQVINLFVIAGLAAYVWRQANPSDPARFVSTSNFRS